MNSNYEQNSKPNHSWQFIIYIVVGQMGLDHGRKSSLQKHGSNGGLQEGVDDVGKLDICKHQS